MAEKKKKKKKEKENSRTYELQGGFFCTHFLQEGDLIPISERHMYFSDFMKNPVPDTPEGARLVKVMTEEYMDAFKALSRLHKWLLFAPVNSIASPQQFCFGIYSLDELFDQLLVVDLECAT